MSNNNYNKEKFKSGVPRRVYELLAQQIMDDYGIKQGRCLDIGTGKGQIGLEIAKRSSLFLYLLDIKSESLSQAEEKIIELGLLSRTAVIKSPVEQLPFLDNYFHLVVSRGSIFFWEDKAQGLREIQRVLKPGGVAFIGGGTSRYMAREEVDEFFEWARETHRKHNPDWDRQSSPEHLLEEINKSGITGYSMSTGYGTWIEIRKD